MSVSTDSSTPVDYLLRELARLRGENRKLQGRIGGLRKSRDEWKRRARARLEIRLRPDDPRHGTTNGYSNLGCRCDRCRDANRRACNEYAWRTGRHTPAPIYRAQRRSEAEARDSHGTESRYTNLGCRCDECKRAAARARNRRRYETPEKVERQRAYDRERKRRVSEQERMKAAG